MHHCRRALQNPHTQTPPLIPRRGHIRYIPRRGHIRPIRTGGFHIRPIRTGGFHIRPLVITTRHFPPIPIRNPIPIQGAYGMRPYGIDFFHFF